MNHAFRGAVAFFICLLILGVGPSQAQLIHENPHDIAPISVYDTDRIPTSADDLFADMDDILTSLYGGDYVASREALNRFRVSHGDYAGIIKMYNLSDEQTKLVIDRLNLTSDEMQALIDSSEAYDRDYSDFTAYVDADDSGNVTPAADRLQSHYANLSSSAKAITDDSTFILNQLSGVDPDISIPENFLGSLSDYTARVASANQRPSSLANNASLLLSCDRAEARAGDQLTMAARLSLANSSAASRAIDFYADNVLVGSASTDASGLCLFTCPVAVSSFRDPLLLSASLSPQDGMPALASNLVEVRRLQEPVSLQITSYPGQVKFGEGAEVRGSLVTISGYPVPRRNVSIWLGDQHLGSAKTGSDGTFVYLLNVSTDTPSGQTSLTARYDQRPGDAIPDTTSGEFLLDVLQESTQLSLDPPVSQDRGTSACFFNGTLLTGSGRPVGGANIGICTNSSLLGNGTTDRNGTYSILLTVPPGTAGGSTADLYAAYQPGEVRALAGSQSQVYALTIEPGTPAIAIWPFTAVSFDLRITLLLGALILAGIMLAAKIAGIDRIFFRRKPGKEAPAPDGSAAFSGEPAEPGEAPEQAQSFEAEIANIYRFISSGRDARETLTQIYLVLRKLARSHGLAVEAWDTHRDLSRMLSEQHPSLEASLNTIIFYYEHAVFGSYQPNGQDILNALYCLREINVALTGGEGQ